MDMFDMFASLMPLRPIKTSISSTEWLHQAEIKAFMISWFHNLLQWQTLALA